jgi:hypothetical protein
MHIEDHADWRVHEIACSHIMLDRPRELASRFFEEAIRWARERL